MAVNGIDDYRYFKAFKDYEHINALRYSMAWIL